ncbi:hypothetical protein C8T65DRAFT_700004 [Cerioporus squamosus]|nr:hypothetical protein C8T65DRAFT_700004 [Cerioporus squamosus]
MAASAGPSAARWGGPTGLWGDETAEPLPEVDGTVSLVRTATTAGQANAHSIREVSIRLSGTGFVGQIGWDYVREVVFPFLPTFDGAKEWPDVPNLTIWTHGLSPSALEQLHKLRRIFIWLSRPASVEESDRKVQLWSTLCEAAVAQTAGIRFDPVDALCQWLLTAEAMLPDQVWKISVDAFGIKGSSVRLNMSRSLPQRPTLFEQALRDSARTETAAAAANDAPDASRTFGLPPPLVTVTVPALPFAEQLTESQAASGTLPAPVARAIAPGASTSMSVPGHPSNRTRGDQTSAVSGPTTGPSVPVTSHIHATSDGTTRRLRPSTVQETTRDPAHDSGTVATTSKGKDPGAGAISLPSKQGAEPRIEAPGSTAATKKAGRSSRKATYPPLRLPSPFPESFEFDEDELVDHWVQMAVMCTGCRKLGVTCRVNFLHGAMCNHCTNGQAACSLVPCDVKGHSWNHAQRAYILFDFQRIGDVTAQHPVQSIRPMFAGDPDFVPPEWFMQRFQALKPSRWAKGSKWRATKPRSAMAKRARFLAPTSDMDYEPNSSDAEPGNSSDPTNTIPAARRRAARKPATTSTSADNAARESEDSDHSPPPRRLLTRRRLEKRPAAVVSDEDSSSGAAHDYSRAHDEYGSREDIGHSSSDNPNSTDGEAGLGTSGTSVRLHRKRPIKRARIENDFSEDVFHHTDERDVGFQDNLVLEMSDLTGAPDYQMETPPPPSILAVEQSLSTDEVYSRVNSNFMSLDMEDHSLRTSLTILEESIAAGRSDVQREISDLRESVRHTLEEHGSVNARLNNALDELCKQRTEMQQMQQLLNTLLLERLDMGLSRTDDATTSSAHCEPGALHPGRSDSGTHAPGIPVSSSSSTRLPAPHTTDNMRTPKAVTTTLPSSTTIAQARRGSDSLVMVPGPVARTLTTSNVLGIRALRELYG